MLLERLDQFFDDLDQSQESDTSPNIHLGKTTRFHQQVHELGPEILRLKDVVYRKLITETLLFTTGCAALSVEWGTSFISEAQLLSLTGLVAIYILNLSACVKSENYQQLSLAEKKLRKLLNQNNIPVVYLSELYGFLEDYFQEEGVLQQIKTLGR